MTERENGASRLCGAMREREAGRCKLERSRRKRGIVAGSLRSVREGGGGGGEGRQEEGGSVCDDLRFQVGSGRLSRARARHWRSGPSRTVTSQVRSEVVQFRSGNLSRI
eukprot:1435352-Rhodomonas_salina.1